MQTCDDNDPQALFVVILREFLVARDIEMIIRSFCSEARVILARTLDDAMAALPSGRIRAAFIQMDPKIFSETEFSQRVASDGGRTVLVGLDVDEAVPTGWATLRFPFAEHDVSALLAREAMAGQNQNLDAGP
jgi:hypothetical protein